MQVVKKPDVKAENKNQGKQTKSRKEPAKPLTEDQVMAIIALAKKGLAPSEICQKVGCTRNQVQRVIYTYKKKCKELGKDHGIPTRRGIAEKGSGAVSKTIDAIASGSVNVDDILKKFGF